MGYIIKNWGLNFLGTFWWFYKGFTRALWGFCLMVFTRALWGFCLEEFFIVLLFFFFFHTTERQQQQQQQLPQCVVYILILLLLYSLYTRVLCFCSYYWKKNKTLENKGFFLGFQLVHLLLSVSVSILYDSNQLTEQQQQQQYWEDITLSVYLSILLHFILILLSVMDVAAFGLFLFLLWLIVVFFLFFQLQLQ